MSWLDELVEYEMTPDALAETLDLTGTAVERIERGEGGLDGVIVARILQIRPHPDADRLRLALVDAGPAGSMKVVCGAPNIEVGQLVPLAVVGTLMPGGLEIKKAKIRGVESNGMLCSAKELGIAEDAAGILVLDGEPEPGTPVAGLLGLDETVLELEVTPNRPDCLSMIGIARELAAITGSPRRMPRAWIEEGTLLAEEAAAVATGDPTLCPRYTARVVTGITIGPSPQWMQRRLVACGMRPINNVVDITNYVLLETGQPLHAFDLDKLTGARVVARPARYGESLTTLDGVVRALQSGMLVIADDSGPLAVAGIMGGSSTEVGDGTKAVLIESANFEPGSIGRTSRALGLRTEASTRFEKGLDPNATLYAANRAAQLLMELAGGTIAEGILDDYPKRFRPWKVALRTERVRRLIGIQVDDATIVSVLNRLGIETTPAGPGLIEAVPPTDRRDLQREVDLIEEFVRLFGFGNLPATLPRGAGGGRHARDEKGIRIIAAELAGLGFQEAVTYSFIGAEDFRAAGIPAESPLSRARALTNPLSEEMSMLRTTLIPGLFRAAAENASRGAEDLALFEIGRVFRSGASRLPEERQALAIALAGELQEADWAGPAGRGGFFALKGALARLFERLGLQATYERFEFASFRPGSCARIIIDGSVAGVIGEMDAPLLERGGMRRGMAVCELWLDTLIAERQPEDAGGSLPRYPVVTVDLAFVCDERTEYGSISEAIDRHRSERLVSWELFDRYIGDKVERGRKSLAVRFTYRAEERTLTDEEVSAASEALAGELSGELGISVRRA